MAALKSFKELIVWQESVNLVEMICRHTQTSPEDEKFGLVSQTRRAAISIPTNIAEDPLPRILCPVQLPGRVS
ncbi:MAG: four helix bundle protein [Spirochaetaceae bacterium]|jgi:hypothetical protein|nr:four helix bundle protein [Spirochaetaceae bacterium]